MKKLVLTSILIFFLSFLSLFIFQVQALDVTATNGSAKAIQEAVDQVAAAGGGTVYIPEGNFIFTTSYSEYKTTSNGMLAAVIIPGGVNIFGAGSDKTILQQPTDPPTGAGMFFIDGANNKSVRISGIKFDGYVSNENFDTWAITALGVKDFRIDHNYFEDFSSTAIFTSKYQRQNSIHRGVIDHNNFDNPYKDTIGGAWAYGIIVYGDVISWPTLDSILGKYDDNVVYIEDNTFSRTRHAVDANGGGYYVARYNTFKEPRPQNYPMISTHGGMGPQGFGTRGLEAYNNTIFAASGYPSSMAFGIRGGGGVIFNNTIYDCQYGVVLSTEAPGYNPDYVVKDIWIWDNMFNNVAIPFYDQREAYEGPPGYVENVDYFLYARPNYQPYPYPHPLTLTEITAANGSAKAIQAAVDQVAAAGGGNVYIPAGTFNFVEVGEPWMTVNIPAGVNLFGAPTERDANNQVIEWKTVLVMPFDAPTGSVWFRITGNSNPAKTSRFSDIKLIGYRDFNATSTSVHRAIIVDSVIDFRIDHCFFKHTTGGISIGGLYSRGVVDHCKFINDYGIPYPYELLTVGYGIAVMRTWDTTEWEDDISNVVGEYTNYTVFIEDSYLSRWRHDIAANNGAHYVFRYNTIEKDCGFGSLDAHGTYTNIGTRAIEIYENRIIDPVRCDSYNSTIPHGGGVGVFWRGGGGVVFNNYVRNYRHFLSFSDEGPIEKTWPHDIWIWNNTYENVPTPYIVGAGNATLNDDYFLYEKPGYTPYPYPHPLTLGGTPNITQPTKAAISGRLKDKSNNPMNAKIIILQQNTNNIVNSTVTDLNGNYNLAVPPGTYDIQFNLTSFYIPNYYIRIPSVSVSSDIYDLIKHITGYSEENKVALAIDIAEKIIQTYSGTKPSRVLINGTVLSNVSSLSDLKTNTWFHNSSNQKLYVYASTYLPFSDEFSSSGLDSRWSWFNLPQSYDLTTRPGWLHTITKTNTDFWNSVETGHFSYQTTSGNFIIETRVSSNLAVNYQESGLMIRQGTNNWILLKFIYYNGLTIRSTSTNGGVSSTINSTPLPSGTTEVYVRITRNSNSFTADYSLDGISWNKHASWTQTLTDPLMVGLFSADGGSNTNFESYFDYFRYNPL